MNLNHEGVSGDKPKATVCIVTPYAPSISETFISAHVERLPGQVVLIHGWRPTVGERPVLSFPTLVIHKALRMLTGRSLEHEITSSYTIAFRRYQAAAVLAEYGTTGVLTVDACKRLNIPLIVYFFGFDASVRSVLEEHAESYRRMFREAAAIIAISRSIRDKLISLGASPDKVRYIPCGVDCEQFGGAEPAQAAPVFLAIGRFVEKKAPDLTIAAFAKVYRECPQARLRMVGDGPLLAQCRSLAKELNVDDAVTFLGERTHGAVADEMRRARCFVQHSVEAPSGDCEGTPLGILEAGASALPVVSTRHAGIPDVVVDGETGFLVAEKDVNGMAEQMLRLARDPELARSLGLAARRRIEENFTIEQTLMRLWTVITESIATDRTKPLRASNEK
jgi:glycosyltransferase involved in cell wall biosynthesis